MEKSTTQLTIDYIKEHPHIKNCLKKGLINYSALARMISEELKIEKKSSNEAILVAARRFKDNLKKEIENEKKIKAVLSDSEISIKNKVAVFILDKGVKAESVLDLQKGIKKENGIAYFLEGASSYTLIVQEKYSSDVSKSFKNWILKVHKDLAIIDLKTSSKIEGTQGVLSYLTSIFAENGVNIVEFMSCWEDTIFVIGRKDVDKAIGFLDF